MDPISSESLERILLWAVAPLWLLAGSLDSACHRRLRIETSSGTPEAVLHLTMLLELGVAVLVALFLELNAAAFLVMYVAVVAHEATMWTDLGYAESRRRVPWYEQVVHGIQHALPWVVLAALMVLHPAQALAVFGLGDEQADWRIMLKQHPLPGTFHFLFLGTAFLAVIWPFVAELRRCLRVQQRAT